MICNYEEYLCLAKTISFEECLRLHGEMIQEISNDEDAVEMYEFLLEKATDYATYRSRWTTRNKEWKFNSDPQRTATHDVLINNFNMLARYLKNIGKKAGWRDTLGYIEEDPANRKRIGDFACYLVFVHALNGR